LRHGALSIGDERLVSELTRAFASYLGAGNPKPRLHVSTRRNPA